jgi:polar amino acid transport system permease protein
MHWATLWEYRQALVDGLVRTLMLTGAAIPTSLVLGVVLGCIAATTGWIGRELVAMFVSPMRNLPIVVKLFFFYFVLGMEAWPAGIATLVLHHAAYIAEITRAGIRSVPREQFEAARACGHSLWQVFRLVIIPQVMRVILPSLTSQFIDVVKNSSVCMLVGLQELTFQTQEIDHITFRGFEAATAASVLYLAVAVVIAFAMYLLRRFAFQKGER